jgi:hypothetical protein
MSPKYRRPPLCLNTFQLLAIAINERPAKHAPLSGMQQLGDIYRRGDAIHWLDQPIGCPLMQNRNESTKNQRQLFIVTISGSLLQAGGLRSLLCVFLYA